MLGRLKFNLDALVNEMLDQLPKVLWESDTTTFFDPAMGGGQFLFNVVERLRKHGHSDENIAGRVYGMEQNLLRVNYVKGKGLIGQYSIGGIKELEEMEMEFDVIVGNPPYVDGTKGKANIWDKFVENLIDSSTILAMVVPSSLAISDHAGNGVCRKLLKEKGLKAFKFLPWSTFNVTVATCYFIADDNHTGDTKVTDIYGVSYQSSEDYFVSNAIAASILNKVRNKTTNADPYTFKSYKAGTELVTKVVDKVNQVGFTTIDKNDSQRDTNVCRVVTTYLNNGPIASEYHKDMLHLKAVQVVKPGVGVQSKHRYIVCKTEEDATNVASYLRSNLCNIIWAFTRTSRTLDNPQVRFIPAIGSLKAWTDELLCDYFGLTEAETDYVVNFYQDKKS